jgi:hypothetical protein
MGHTHYWSFTSNRGKTSQMEKKYQIAIRKCAKVVRYYSETFGGLSGYTAHDKTFQYGGLKVNGSARVGQCEDFIMREHLSENETFSFCKTRQYPYDTVVTACLIILKHYLGDSIEVKSDGFVSEWADGLILAQKILGLKTLRIPLTIKERARVA